MSRHSIVLGAGLALVAATCAHVVVFVASDRGGRSEQAEPDRGSSGIEARTTLEPRTILFGDTLRATVDVTLDRRRVDPDSVRVSADFAPWGVVEEPGQTRHDSGDTTHLRVAFVLRCLTTPCAPSGQLISVELPSAKVAYTGPNGETTGRDILELEWPRLGVYSRSSTSVLDARGSSIPWRGDLLSLPSVSYRVSPTVALVAVLLVGALFVAGAIALVYLAWPRPEPAPPPEPELPPEPQLSPLEQALALLEDTMRTNGVADRRRALELVADVLAVHEDDLAEAARTLAWSEAPPQVEQTKDLAALVRSALELVENEESEENADAD